MRLLVLLSSGATVAAFAMAAWGFDKDTLWFEIGKLVAQLGLITGFGAIVTLLVHEFQRDQEEAQRRVADEQRRAEAQQEWLRNILMRTSLAYTDLKQARRTLQAALASNAAVDGGDGIRASIYDDQLAGISEVQTDFENLHTEVRSYVSQDSPQGVAAEVSQELSLIKDWLSGLVTEWKDHPQPGKEMPPAMVALTDLNTLRTFVARSREEKTFANGFGQIKDAYKRIERAIWKHVTAPDSGVPSDAP